MRFSNYLQAIIFTVAVLNSSPADAQRFKGGVIAGFNLSQIDGDDLAGFNKIGVNSGIYSSMILSDRWQLSLELLFSQLGSNQNTNDGFNAAFDKINLNVVEVPVLLNFLEWKFHVQGGISYNRLISKKIIQISGDDVSETTPIEENMFALALGVTYFSSEKIGFNFRWSKSLNNINGIPGGNRWLNRYISIRLYYLFN